MKTLEKHELTERIDEVLRLVKEKGETFEVTEHGEVIARLGPASEPKHAVEESDAAVWAELDRLSAEISAHWPAGVSAVDAVRDVRGER
jgi:antitoxin (DNA-binding transcriptional repressor) of toxin-antitoxin stability system